MPSQQELKEDKINLSKIYTHYKNKKLYIPTQFCMIQEDGVWIDAISYRCMEDPSKVFVRSQKEFIEKFNRYQPKF